MYHFFKGNSVNSCLFALMNRAPISVSAAELRMCFNTMHSMVMTPFSGMIVFLSCIFNVSKYTMAIAYVNI